VELYNTALLGVNLVLLLLGYGLLLRVVSTLNYNKKMMNEFTTMVFKHLKRRR